MVAKHSQQRRFLILLCQLFLPLRGRIRQVLDCSLTNMERELGLDRYEIGTCHSTNAVLLPCTGSDIRPMRLAEEPIGGSHHL